MDEQAVEVDSRMELALLINQLSDSAWSDNVGEQDEFGNVEPTYPIVLEFGREVIYDPIAWSLIKSGIDKVDILYMDESDAERHMKQLFHINRHEVRAISLLNIGKSPDDAKKQIYDYLTNRG